MKRDSVLHRIFLATFLWSLVVQVDAVPLHVYLTWQRDDTSRSITVNFQTKEKGESQVFYDTQSHGGDPSKYRFQALGNAHRIDQHPDNRYIHWVPLSDLSPGESYYFIAGNSQDGFSEERKFKTIPDQGSPIRFITGGDMGTGPLLVPLVQQAARQDPAFGLVGGDIAYANGELKNYKLWDIWLDVWETNMVTSSGYTIPMVLALGNHEVNGGLAVAGGKAPFFFGYFAQDPNQSYFSRKFGEHLVVMCLDSGHVAAHAGDQTEWLAATLEQHQDLKLKFAVYHAPLFPSHRPFIDIWSCSGRAYWMPLFDRYHLTTAFENHDHTFKRTHLIKAGQLDPSGTLYLGDGCWGKEPRGVDRTRRWYEKKAASIPHFWRVDTSSNGAEYCAINGDGKIFDVYPESSHLTKIAEENFKLLTMPQESLSAAKP